MRTTSTSPARLSPDAGGARDARSPAIMPALIGENADATPPDLPGRWDGEPTQDPGAAAV